MRMRLKSYREVPPNSYRYTVPETGHQITAWSVESWLSKTKQHLEANNLPIPIDLLAIMEAQLCEILPVGWCEHDDPNRPRVDTNITWGDVETGSKTLFEWFKQGLPIVDQDEAERRAKICTSCYLNVRAVGCGQSCRELIRAMFGFFVGRKTSVDDQLNSCAACKCLLKNKVFAPLTVIEKYDSDSLQMLLPSFCWLKRGGGNYKSE